MFPRGETLFFYILSNKYSLDEHKWLHLKQGQFIRFIVTWYNIKTTEAFKPIEENRKQTETFKLRYT